MKNTKPLLFPSDYDWLGMLTLPWLFWCVLLLQARSFITVMHSGAFDGVHLKDLDLFIALCPGMPALVVFALYARARNYQGWKLWPVGRWLLIIGPCLHLGWPFFHWLEGGAVTGWLVGFFITDMLALWWLLSSRRLWACFTREYGYPSFHYKNRIY